MGKSRSQISQQLVALLNGSGAMGATGSAFEATLGVENFLASRLTFPIAAVETLDCQMDHEVPGRIDVARFRVSVAGSAVAEQSVSSNLASGGTASSQHAAEDAIRDALNTILGPPPWAFTDTDHGFQGMVEGIGTEVLVVGPGQTYAIADLTVAVYDATLADNGFSLPFPVMGPLTAGRLVSVNFLTADRALTVSDTAKFFTTNGASAAITVSLPDEYLLGTTFSFEVGASHQLTIQAATGQTIRSGALTSSSGGSASSTSLGSVTQIVRDGPTSWISAAGDGDWDLS